MILANGGLLNGHDILNVTFNKLIIFYVLI